MNPTCARTAMPGAPARTSSFSAPCWASTPPRPASAAWSSGRSSAAWPARRARSRIPGVTLLGTLGLLRWRAHTAALAGLGAALIVAIAVFGMPPTMALCTAGYGAAYGLLPIGWIVLNVIFLYQLTEKRGLLAVQ